MIRAPSDLGGNSFARAFLAQVTLHSAAGAGLGDERVEEFDPSRSHEDLSAAIDQPSRHPAPDA